MAPRPAVRRERDNDFSAVGRIGRRTGVTLPQGRVDENGLEEITGIFSSPHKPSPMKPRGEAVVAASSTSHGSEGMDGMGSTGLTPSHVLSSRKSLRGPSLPRSSPARKTGINGQARRSQGADLFLPDKETLEFDSEDRENPPVASPAHPSLHQPARRFEPSPEKSPLRDITSTGARNSNGNARALESARRNISRRKSDSSSPKYGPNKDEVVMESIEVAAHSTNPREFDNVVTHEDSDDQIEPDKQAESTKEPQISERNLQQEPKNPTKVPLISTQANSRRKRKSDNVEELAGQESSPTPKAKRQKFESKKIAKPSAMNPPSRSHLSSREPQIAPAQNITRAISNEEANLSTRQQNELNEIIEKVKAKPGKPKSLYILRRETPADDSVTHTRSGRVSVKPLAYWRNERCVYGGSPSSAQLADGARFPLNSIKEIVRIEELDPAIERRRGRKKARGKVRKPTEGSESDFELDERAADPHAEEWETERGIFRGPTSIWDPQQQSILHDAEEEVDLAYAPAAIETREVPGSDFRYAKLLSTGFFGTGIVDLPPGAEKRPKNSKKMLMSFFVFKGRVTVQVGPYGGKQSSFSVGKGGFWTVPRGNQYGIRNELDKPARIFFSQGCEPVAMED